MSLPTQSFSTIQELIAYINTTIVPNSSQEIDAIEHNNVENGLASFIVQYTLNSGLVQISTSAGVKILSSPITVFTTVPSSVQWPDNIQNEYYVINATGFNIPIAGGFSYIDAFQTVQTVFPPRLAIHMAKATNGQWIQVNNIGSGGTGTLPPQTNHGGQVLLTNGASPFWGDNVLQIGPSDPNWVDATTWVNGHAVNNLSFSSAHFVLFWNEFSRFLLQNVSPAEWQYVPNGFQVLTPGFDKSFANVFLFFKGENS